ncbi:MAG TPA: type II toxin-antitoxin system VapC family toxin [Allosphingosinicella sp.]
MRLLLDTHALIWALGDSASLSHRARAAISAADVKLVSAVSAYEICLKHRLGKLRDAAALAANFEEEIAACDALPLPISIAHAVEAGKLDRSHKDPFDRLLIAQSRIEGVPIVSSDTLFDAFGVERVW